MHGPMHPDQLPIDDALVASLIAERFPEWADLPVRRVTSGGTVNALFTLGDELVARLPLKPEWAPDLDREFAWLPRLAAHLPLRIPEPVGRGEPTADYPIPWAVYTWIPGRMAEPSAVHDKDAAAECLAGFVRTLHSLDITGAPHHTHRGLPIQRADARTREVLPNLAGHYDVESVIEVWDRAQAADPWSGDPVWVHGDLWYSNLIVDDAGRLVGVVDCGGFGGGDPAIDLIPAWSLLDRPSRRVFREMVRLDDATWARARGWVINMAAFAIPYYAETNPIITHHSHRMLSEMLSET